MSQMKVKFYNLYLQELQEFLNLELHILPTIKYVPPSTNPPKQINVKTAVSIFLK